MWPTLIRIIFGIKDTCAFEIYMVSLPGGISEMDSKITVILLEDNLTDSITSGQHIRFSINCKNRDWQPNDVRCVCF